MAALGAVPGAESVRLVAALGAVTGPGSPSPPACGASVGRLRAAAARRLCSLRRAARSIFDAACTVTTASTAALPIPWYASHAHVLVLGAACHLKRSKRDTMRFRACVRRSSVMRSSRGSFASRRNSAVPCESRRSSRAKRLAVACLLSVISDDHSMLVPACSCKTERTSSSLTPPSVSSEMEPSALSSSRRCCCVLNWTSTVSTSRNLSLPL